MGNQIWMNYQRTIQQADALDRLAAQMKNISSQEIEACMQGLAAAWAGEYGELYCRKGNRLNAIILQRSQKLSEAAKILRNNAEKMYHAERSAICLVLKET